MVPDPGAMTATNITHHIMNKSEERLAQAMSESGINEATIGRVIARVKEIKDSEKEDGEKKPRKPLLVVTATPLDEPILGWIIAKEEELVGMLDENSEYQEGIAPQSWGDLEIEERIEKVAKYINNNPKLLKKYGKMKCLADVMEHAPTSVTKNNGFVAKTKETPIAIIPVTAFNNNTNK